MSVASKRPQCDVVMKSGLENGKWKGIHGEDRVLVGCIVTCYKGNNKIGQI